MTRGSFSQLNSELLELEHGRTEVHIVSQDNSPFVGGQLAQQTLVLHSKFLRKRGRSVGSQSLADSHTIAYKTLPEMEGPRLPSLFARQLDAVVNSAFVELYSNSGHIQSGHPNQLDCLHLKAVQQVSPL